MPAAVERLSVSLKLAAIRQASRKELVPMANAAAARGKGLPSLASRLPAMVQRWKVQALVATMGMREERLLEIVQSRTVFEPSSTTVYAESGLKTVAGVAMLSVMMQRERAPPKTGEEMAAAAPRRVRPSMTPVVE